MSLVERTLHRDAYSLAELSELFEMTDTDFAQWALSEKTRELRRFELHARASHVFQEAHRVFKFKDACHSGQLDRMGALMRESHSSCKNLYDCSHEQLDRIVDICVAHGALGSRLTGAG